MEEHISQEATNSEPEEIFEVLIWHWAGPELGGDDDEGQDAGEADQEGAEDGPGPLRPVDREPSEDIRGWAGGTEHYIDSCCC